MYIQCFLFYSALNRYNGMELIETISTHSDFVHTLPYHFILQFPCMYQIISYVLKAPLKINKMMITITFKNNIT